MKRQLVEGISVGDGEVALHFEAHRKKLQGRTMQEVGPEIRAKLTWEAMADLMQKVRTEQEKREEVVFDEKLLKEVSIAPPSR